MHRPGTWLLLFALGASAASCDSAGTKGGNIPDSAASDGTTPEASAPDAAQSDAAQSDAAQSDAAQPDPTQWEDSLRLGTWDGRFTPLAASGNAFTLVAGPQGGYHIDIALSFDVQTFEPVRLELDAVDATDQQSLSLPLLRMLDSTKVQRLGAVWVWSGERVIFTSVDPLEIEGRAIEIRARATRNGAVAAVVATGTVSPL